MGNSKALDAVSACESDTAYKKVTKTVLQRGGEHSANMNDSEGAKTKKVGNATPMGGIARPSTT